MSTRWRGPKPFGTEFRAAFMTLGESNRTAIQHFPTWFDCIPVEATSVSSKFSVRAFRELLAATKTATRIRFSKMLRCAGMPGKRRLGLKLVTKRDSPNNVTVGKQHGP